MCCKKIPGICIPKDFSLPKDKGSILKEALVKGHYAIDYWEGDLPGEPKKEDTVYYYIRPAIKGSEKRLVHPSWGGECTFLTPVGCRLKSSERPHECKLLKPSQDENGRFNCSLEPDISKADLIRTWIPYLSLIENIIGEINRSNI